MAAPSGRWKISFASNSDWDEGKFSSGFLVFWSSTNWLLLQNDLEVPLIGRVQENGKTLHVGSIVRFPSHMAKITQCFSSPWSEVEPTPLKWKVTCSSFVNGAWSGKRNGFLILRPLAKRLVLLDEQDVLIDARFLLEEESISPGLHIELPVHKVIVGEQISNLPPTIAHANVYQANVDIPFSLNFAKGIKFCEVMQQKFGHSVNFVPGFRKREFFLVAAFGRTSFKLNVHTVSIALQACFGSQAAKFQVKLLCERVFRFSVESRSIGFEFTMPVK
jgi:hypothetical protein